jgi:ribosomal protein S18 acetylase RimI-like enzyme
MNPTLSDDLQPVDWDRLADIFKRAPLGDRDPAELRLAFGNSGVRCFAWQDGKLVGAGRAITDGVRYAAIFDVVLLPEFQGKGLGKAMMLYLKEKSKARNVLLHSVPGKEKFYEKLGYRRMRTAMGLFENPDAQKRGGYIE